MPRTLRKILFFLTINGKKKLILLVAAIIVMSVFEMTGVAVIFPFLNVISDPTIIDTNSTYKLIYDKFGFVSKDSFLLALGACFFSLLVVINILRVTVDTVLIRFTCNTRYYISKELMFKYLYEPYVFFLNRNSSELTSYLASEIARVVSSVLVPSMHVFAQSLLVVLLAGLLIKVNPAIAIVLTLIIGVGYLVIYVIIKKKLSEKGGDLSRYSKAILKALNEAFGGIKDIKLLGKEEVFISRYSVPIRECARHYCWQNLISQCPKYAFEVIAFGGVLLMAIYMTIIRNNYQQVVPIIGLYVFAAYRLLPALQKIYSDLTLIHFGIPALELVYEDYINCKGQYGKRTSDPVSIMPFDKNIDFRSVVFRYPKTQEPVIDNLDLTVTVNTTVGLVGGSGVGKTTLIDILLGLLRPQRGELLVDGKIIEEHNLRSWQANIGYVPQHIYLCDDTITRNIAFGVPDQDVDNHAVKRAAKLASIDDFIVNELPHGYDTEIGERGVRLSGGQRQRLGIARALYHNPSLLVFDEATSALDGITEDDILEAINNLTRKKTIIIIAHRFSTVKECDVIYMLERGRIVGQGTYAQLIDNNEQFRQMAKIGPGKNGQEI